jgi:hypothetical protein
MMLQVDFVIENIIAKCMKDNTPKNVQFFFCGLGIFLLIMNI